MGMKQLVAARHMGMSPQAFSDRVRGRTPWTLDELDVATTTLEMDLSSILAPVDGDTSLSLFEPLDHTDDGADVDVADIGAGGVDADIGADAAVALTTT